MLPVCAGWQGTMQIGGDFRNLEPPKSQPTLELKSSQVGVPTCFFIRVLKIRLDVAHVHGVAGNNAEPCR